MLNSNTSENMLMLHKLKSKKTDITFLRPSNESHIQWKKHIYKYIVYFRIYALFEADKEFD